MFTRVAGAHVTLKSFHVPTTSIEEEFIISGIAMRDSENEIQNMEHNSLQTSHCANKASVNIFVFTTVIVKSGISDGNIVHSRH